MMFFFTLSCFRLEKPAPVAWQRTDNWSANKVVEVLKSQVTSIAPDLLKASLNTLGLLNL